jgi:hypothetical protein
VGVRVCVLARQFWCVCVCELAITSPTSGGRSVGIVRSRTQTMEFSLVFLVFS